jgi:hypothetical protein
MPRYPRYRQAADPAAAPPALDRGDGADLALLAVLQYDHIAARFSRVVIASGDQPAA